MFIHLAGIKNVIFTTLVISHCLLWGLLFEIGADIQLGKKRVKHKIYRSLKIQWDKLEKTRILDTNNKDRQDIVKLETWTNIENKK